MSNRRRPATGEGTRLRAINTKVTEAFRLRLEEAARVSGRTLSSEVERRLEQSFIAEDIARSVRDQIRAEFASREPVSSIPPQAMRQVWSRPSVVSN